MHCNKKQDNCAGVGGRVPQPCSETAHAEPVEALPWFLRYRAILKAKDGPSTSAGWTGPGGLASCQPPLTLLGPRHAPRPAQPVHLDLPHRPRNRLVHRLQAHPHRNRRLADAGCGGQAGGAGGVEGAVNISGLGLGHGRWEVGHQSY